MRAPEIVLGNSPPRSWSTLKADLIRLFNEYDLDVEESNASSMQAKLISYNRIQLVDALLNHIEPTVADEAAAWDAIERDLDNAKEHGI